MIKLNNVYKVVLYTLSLGRRVKLRLFDKSSSFMAEDIQYVRIEIKSFFDTSDGMIFFLDLHIEHKHTNLRISLKKKLLPRVLPDP